LSGSTSGFTFLTEKKQQTGVVEVASSEETPTVEQLGGKGFAVAFDPLDGSSVVDANFSFGSIFGIWPGSDLVCLVN
jgi:fructose-1,6-bisphosphatase